MDCPRSIKSVLSILPNVVVANQALHENTKVRGPGVEASLVKSVPNILMHRLHLDYVTCDHQQVV